MNTQSSPKIVIHRENTRGAADHGWLKAKHSFSFGSWHNPERMGFGLLRVINDDVIAPAMGFATHPHRNMEIVTIPLRGALRHKDSEGHEAVIEHGEVQMMSAGTGVFHSEYNASEEQDINLLQIWIMPENLDIPPRYDQKRFEISERQNQWQKLVSPLDKNEPGIKVNQQTRFSIVDLEADNGINYQSHDPSFGTYFFVIEGSITLAQAELTRRDAAGVQEFDSIELKAKLPSTVLAIEIPMTRHSK